MDFGKICKLPKDGDYILFNTIYHANTDKGDRRSSDAITLIFKNLTTGKKVIREIIDPEIEIYMAKPDVQLGKYVHVDIPIDDVDIYDVSYKNKLRDMAKLLNREDFYWDCLKTRRMSELNQIMMCNKFFSADRNIEDFYRYKSLKYFGQKELRNTTKAFFDIEADIMKGYIDLKKTEGDAPVNIVTLMDDITGTSYTIIKREPDNPLVAILEEDIQNFIPEAEEALKDKYNLDIKVKIAFVDEELDVITTLFALINDLKRDFMLAWNQSFDCGYMIHRLKCLGVDPAEVMCHEDFKWKECFYAKDTRNFEIKKKTDWFKLSSYSVFIDQMINYAAIRKSGAKIDSYKLDFIGEREVNAGKLDYSEVSHLKYLPYVNFRKYVLYNIFDVGVQLAIERKVKDIDDLFYRSYSSNTRFSKVFKEITFLTNVAFMDFEKYGVILGNNVNAITYNQEQQNLLIEEDKETGKQKFAGALVGDPKLIARVGMRLLGVMSGAVFEDVVDYDFTSLYPSIIKLFNIYKATMLGQLRLAEQEIGKREQRVVYEKYNRSAQVLEDLESNEAIHFCYRWMNLPSAIDVIYLFDEMYEDYKNTKLRIRKKKEETGNSVLRIRRKKVS